MLNLKLSRQLKLLKYSRAISHVACLKSANVSGNITVHNTRICLDPNDGGRDVYWNVGNTLSNDMVDLYSVWPKESSGVVYILEKGVAIYLGVRWEMDGVCGARPQKKQWGY
jgi:hypothetical protein